MNPRLKILIPVFVILVIALLYSLWVPLKPTLHSQGYYMVELTDGNIWYGTITEDEKEFIVLTNLYHFNKSNLSQLIRSDPKLTDPKNIKHEEIITISELGPDNPVLQAIQKYEQ